MLKDIRDLSPILLNDLLCVGGRLQNSSLPISAKHPIILPYDHPVTNLLIQYHHKKEGHFGVNHVLADMNKEFWIIKGHSAVKKVLNSCATCQFWILQILHLVECTRLFPDFIYTLTFI